MQIDGEQIVERKAVKEGNNTQISRERVLKKAETVF